MAAGATSICAAREQQSNKAKGSVVLAGQRQRRAHWGTLALLTSVITVWTLRIDVCAAGDNKATDIDESGWVKFIEGEALPTTGTQCAFRGSPP